MSKTSWPYLKGALKWALFLLITIGASNSCGRKQSKATAPTPAPAAIENGSYDSAEDSFGADDLFAKWQGQQDAFYPLPTDHD